MPALALHDPRPHPRSRVRRSVRRTADDPRMTRYRGGTYSSTVDTVVFADGSTARTDLIRLNPNIDAYSLGFRGRGPDPAVAVPAGELVRGADMRRPVRTRPRWTGSSAIRFPTLGTVELSRRMRAAGHLSGHAHLADHEAIAATQAAIWLFTNGLETGQPTPLDIPVTTAAAPGSVAFEFDGEPPNWQATVQLSADTAVSLVLQKSVDGVRWRDVAASGLNDACRPGSPPPQPRLRRHHIGSPTRPDAARLPVLPPAGRFTGGPRTGVDIDDVTFTLHGAGRYRNAERVVALYDHLVAGARASRLAPWCHG